MPKQKPAAMEKQRGFPAEYLATAAAELIPVPAGWNMVEAAAFPEGFLTAWDAIVIRAGAVSGDTLLCHSIGGGIGTSVVLVGKAMGLSVIGTSRSHWKYSNERDESFVPFIICCIPISVSKVLSPA